MSGEKLGLYLVKLRFTPPKGMTGAGDMELTLTVEAATGALNGLATGHILQGTQQSPQFSATASGAMHSTGLDTATKVGGLSGSGSVSMAPPTIGTYIAPFNASFAVDNKWNGTGQFTIGGHTYQSTVSQVEVKQTASAV